MRSKILIIVASFIFSIVVMLRIVGGFIYSSPPLPEGAVADQIIVDKTNHSLTLMKNGALLKTYSVALGHGGIGPKQVQGDNKVPEGIYHIAGRNPHSQFHLALQISYPEPRDEENARKHGVAPGGNIMIHGLRNGLGWIGPLHKLIDWTAGCVAVTNSEIEEIWRAVPDGVPVKINP